MTDSGSAAPERHTLRKLLLGWPALLAVWGYALWLSCSLVLQFTAPVVHDGVSNVDSDWLRILLPAMYAPTIVVFAYCNWLGWKFFQHN